MPIRACGQAESRAWKNSRRAAGSFFRVVETREGFVRFGFEEVLFEDHRGGHDGARERAAAGFVHAGDMQQAPGPSFLFEAEHGGPERRSYSWTSFRRLCLLVRLRM